MHFITGMGQIFWPSDRAQLPIDEESEEEVQETQIVVEIPPVVLHDNRTVSQEAFKTTMRALDHLQKNPCAFFVEFDLYSKAKDSAYSLGIIPNGGGKTSLNILHELGLLDEQGHMSEEIRSIVENVFKKDRMGFGVTYLHPQTGESLSERYDWTQLSKSQ